MDASSLGGECVGYTAEAPDVRLSWSGASAQLRIFFNDPGGEDTTLVVHQPGRLGMLCNDDTDGVFLGNPFDPEVRLSNPPEGQYDIWVGSYSDESISGTLSISER